MKKNAILIIFIFLLVGLLLGLGLTVKTILGNRLEITTLKDNLVKKDGKLIQLEQQIKELNFDKKELERKNNDLGTKLAKAETDLRETIENTANLNKKIAEILQEKKKLETALADSSKTTEDKIKETVDKSKQALKLMGKQFLEQEKDLLKQMQAIKEKFISINSEKEAIKKAFTEVAAKLDMGKSKFNHYKLGINYEFDKKYQEAVKEYLKIIDIDPEDAYANFCLARIYTNGIKDKERVDYYNNRYIELNDAENANNAVNQELAEKKRVVSVALDNSIQGLNLDNKQRHLKNGKSSKRVETFEEQSFKRHYNLALTYEDTQRYAEAVKEYEKTLELEPLNSDVYYNLGILYDDRIKDKKKAVYYYQKYLELSPGAEDAAQVKAWIAKDNDDLNWQQRLN